MRVGRGIWYNLQFYTVKIVSELVELVARVSYLSLLEVLTWKLSLQVS